jgi:ABC-2 type transport system permease protein
MTAAQTAAPTVHQPLPREDIPMTEALTMHRPTTRPVVRSSAASLPALVGIEIRKSLSTRSGRSLAAAAVVLPSAAMGLAALTGDPFPRAAGPIGAVGIFAALLLMAVGVLSTAGEWTHKTVQTTFLLVPHRGRVLTAKTVSLTLTGAVLAGVATAASAGVLALTFGRNPSWDGALAAMGSVTVAGAAFAVIGAGVGAALGNAPAALTGLYVFVLGVVPVAGIFQPDVTSWVDLNNSVLLLAQGQEETKAAVVMAGWVVVSTVAGAVVTRRRQVA